MTDIASSSARVPRAQVKQQAQLDGGRKAYVKPELRKGPRLGNVTAGKVSAK